jgi:hypothetical protein
MVGNKTGQESGEIPLRPEVSNWKRGVFQLTACTPRRDKRVNVAKPFNDAAAMMSSTISAHVYEVRPRKWLAIPSPARDGHPISQLDETFSYNSR